MEYRIFPMTTYSCHDRMCGADDCINCHPENFHPLAKIRYGQSDDIPDDEPITARDLDRLANDYELRRNL